MQWITRQGEDIWRSDRVQWMNWQGEDIWRRDRVQWMTRQVKTSGEGTGVVDD